MPALLARLIYFFVRQLIAGAIVWVAQSLLNVIVKAVMKMFGATEQQATDVVSNAVFQYIEIMGLTAVTFYSKAPQKITKLLGFTDKGYKVKPSILGEKPIKPTFGAGPKPTAAEVAVVVEENATAIAATKRSTFDTVHKMSTFLIAGLGVPIGAGLLFTNTVDFAAWPSSRYTEFFTKALSLIGVDPDTQYVKAKVLSQEMATKLLAVFTNMGATGMKDPRTNETVPFTRDKFIEIADYVGSEIVLESGGVTTRQMMGVLTALITIDGKQAPGGFVAPVAGSTGGGSTSGTKVFTGLVSQGTLGASLSFVARPDDIIQSVAELQDAAQNNLAAYLTTLPSKIIYEIKVVSSVTTRDGFRQVGASQQVISGYDSAGKPRYRTVVNKFATLTLYVLTDKGTKSKLTTIILGPTDALRLNPTQSTLVDLERSIQNSIFTSNLNDITGVQNEQFIPTIAPPAYLSPEQISSGSMPVGSSPDTTAGTAGGVSLVGQNATTLSEWYQAHGKPLPSVAERSKIYEEYGLGLSTLYTGTAEQNTKLLAALKRGKQPASSPAVAVPSLGGSLNYTPKAGGTYYNNGKNGTPVEVYGNDAYWQNQEYQKVVGALLANPRERNIKGNPAYDFVQGNISLERLANIVNGSPDYDPTIGPVWT